MKPGIANSAWLAACLPEYVRFHRSLWRVDKAQSAVLELILRRNRNTEFGQQHRFSSIRDVDDFRKQVPLGNYESHSHFIQRAACGVPNVLTKERICLFEPTGGSSGASKLIPYTRSLQHEFQRGIAVWIADLFLHYRDLIGGKAFWSVSPFVGKHEETSGGIPIGFDDDLAYTGSWQQRFLQSVMAVPGDLCRVSDIELFRYRTLFYLLRLRDLRLISIWHPSYLTVLLSRLPEWSERLCHDIEHGARCPPDPRRATEVRRALKASAPQDQYQLLWPRLRLISCWKDANAAGPASALMRLFPGVHVQGKGLLATEAFMSLPLLRHAGSALAVRSHFFEFLPDAGGPSLLAHQLEVGGRYSIVVTTSGGLYRYQMGDHIEVTGFIGHCPLIRFIGRSALVSDWVGEKLTEAHVSLVLQESFQTLGMSPVFAMLSCESAPGPHYVLFLESADNDEIVSRAVAAIETGLRSNFYYDYARRLGQLGPLAVLRLDNAAKKFERQAIRLGQRAGDIKPQALDGRNGWAEVLLHQD
jgi:hypothetical protein